MLSSLENSFFKEEKEVVKQKRFCPFCSSSSLQIFIVDKLIKQENDLHLFMPANETRMIIITHKYQYINKQKMMKTKKILSIYLKKVFKFKKKKKFLLTISSPMLEFQIKIKSGGK